MNKLMLSGRLTKKPELRRSNSGKYFTSFDVAVQKAFKNENGNYDADFFRVSLFGASAEYLCKWGDKGSMLILQCRLQNHDYEQDGQRVWRDQIIGETVEIVSGFSQTNQQENPTQSQTQYQQAAQQPQQQYQSQFTTDMNVSDEDLPF